MTRLALLFATTQPKLSAYDRRCILDATLERVVVFAANSCITHPTLPPKRSCGVCFASLATLRCHLPTQPNCQRSELKHGAPRTAFAFQLVPKWTGKRSRRFAASCRAIPRGETIKLRFPRRLVNGFREVFQSFSRLSPAVSVAREKQSVSPRRFRSRARSAIFREKFPSTAAGASLTQNFGNPSLLVGSLLRLRSMGSPWERR